MMTSLFKRAFREVMAPRVISDITLKMEVAKKTSQDALTALFFDMCNVGIALYLQSEKEKYPGKSDKELMRDSYARRKQLNSGRSDHREFV